MPSCRKIHQCVVYTLNLKWKIQVKILGLSQIKYMNDIQDFLTPVNFYEIINDEPLTDGHIGKHIDVFYDSFPNIDQSDIVILGVPEYRGNGNREEVENGPDIIRKKFYKLHLWHSDFKLADLGNVKQGIELADTYAALKTVLSELIHAGKKVIILGGTHDLTLAQYEAYKVLEKTIEVSCVDAAVDLHGESNIRSENFLLDLLTGEPNLVKHYNHIGFQSYFVHPRMMETMDKLRFDCFRVGRVQEMIEDMEPPIRHTNLFSFDINAIKHSDAPAGRMSPNGLTGTEACTLMRYAGMSNNLSTAGIYGYIPHLDRGGLTAMQIAQMMWYFIDGYHRLQQDVVPGENNNAFIEYLTAFSQVETTFVQSKKTKRWWMKMPDSRWVACSQKDYIEASANLYPERWLRIQERDY